MPSSWPRNFDCAMKSALPTLALAVLMSATPPAAAAPRTHQIVIDRMKFGPMPAEVRVGDRLLWINRDLFRHTASSASAGFDADLSAGSQKLVLIRKPGAFAVTCRYHPGMRATLRVGR